MATQTPRRPSVTTSDGITPGTRASSTGQATPAQADTSAQPVIAGRLFDGAGEDRDVTVTRELVRDLGARQTLWVDLIDPDDATIATIARLWDLAPETVRRVHAGSDRPHVAAFDSYLQLFVTTVELDEDSERAAHLAIIAGASVVITVHRESVGFLDAFQAHLRGDTLIGLIDGPAFVAVLLDWLLTGYFRAVEQLEDAADRLDHRALHPRSERDLLSDLVTLRRRISTLRRTLAPHREVFAALARPELTGLGDPEDVVHFRALAERLERAIDAIDTARELVLGSFDVHMTRTSQRTNDVMKLLTLVTVILLPSSVLAGVMGMNFAVPFFEDASFFWVVLVVMIVIAVATVVVARARRWI